MTTLSRSTGFAAPSRAFSVSTEGRFDGRQLKPEQGSMRRHAREPRLIGTRDRQETEATAFGATVGSNPPTSEYSLRASRRAKTCG